MDLSNCHEGGWRHLTTSEMTLLAAEGACPLALRLTDPSGAEQALLIACESVTPERPLKPLEANPFGQRQVSIMGRGDVPTLDPR